MTEKNFKKIIRRSEEIFNNTYYKVLYRNNLNGAVIPSLIEICLLDAFEEIYGSRVMHGAESTGHDIEHRYFKNIAAEVKATSNVKGLKFSQNVCEGNDKFPNKNEKILHILIAFDKDLSGNKPKIQFKKIFVGKISYNDWKPKGIRSLYLTKKTIKENCILIK